MYRIPTAISLAAIILLIASPVPARAASECAGIFAQTLPELVREYAGWGIHHYFAWTAPQEVIASHPDAAIERGWAGASSFNEGKTEFLAGALPSHPSWLVKATYEVGESRYGNGDAELRLVSSKIDDLQKQATLGPERDAHFALTWDRYGTIISETEIRHYQTREAGLDPERATTVAITDASGKTVSVMRLFDGSAYPGARRETLGAKREPDGTETLPLKKDYGDEIILPEMVEDGELAEVYEAGCMAGDVLTKGNEDALLSAIAKYVWLKKKTKAYRNPIFQSITGLYIGRLKGSIYGVATEDGMNRHKKFGFEPMDFKLHPAPDGTPRFLIRLRIRDLLWRYKPWNGNPIIPKPIPSTDIPG